MKRNKFRWLTLLLITQFVIASFLPVYAEENVEKQTNSNLC